ncbi:MAG TPA: Fur family transcriptional regulator [Dehalococcoidia bacterium]|nr:Fur family transcriptional regulator [Dehalococcoidia bacterium]
MSGHTSIIDSLRETGYRLTPQRMMVVSILHDSPGHITAEDIHARMVEHYPYVDISTVYRTLQLLKKLHIVSETDLGGGSVRFELTQQDPHHHMVCRSCGRTFALDNGLIEPLRSGILDQYGFQADMEHFAIFGVCKDCRDSADKRQPARS